MLLVVIMSSEVWRIVYKNVDWKEWKPIDRLYGSKGTATGVLKRTHAVSWDDQNKVWITIDRKLVFRIQSSELIWRDYEQQ